MASKDTAVGENLLTENIEAPRANRVMPGDYSGEIRAAREGQALKAEIPKSMAQIVEHYDDFKISTWAIDQRKDTQLQYQENELELQDKMKILADKRFNLISDKMEQYNSEKIEVMRNAELSDEEKTGKILELNERFKQPDDFKLIPALQQDWVQRFRPEAERSLQVAQLDDIKTEEQRAEFNVRNIAERSRNKILTGEMTALDTFKTDFPSMQKWLLSRTPTDRAKILSAVWSSAVKAEGEFWINQLNQENSNVTPDQVNKALQAIASKYVNVTFDYTNEDGSVMVGKDGKPMQISVAVDDTIQDFLAHGVNISREQSGSGVDSAPATELLNNIQKIMNWDEFTKQGFSVKANSYTADRFQQEFENAAAYISNSNLSSAKKQSTLDELTKMQAQLSVSREVARFAKFAKGETGKFIANAYRDITADLQNPDGHDWSKYKKEYKPSGCSQGINIGPSLWPNYIRMGDVNKACYLYMQSYSEVLGRMSKLINDGEPGKLLNSIDVDYRQGYTKALSMISASELTVGKGAEARLNTEGVTKFTSVLAGMRTVAAQYGFTDDAFSQSFMKEIANRLNDKENGMDSVHTKLVASRCVVKAFENNNSLYVVADYAKQNNDHKFMTALALNVVDPAIAGKVMNMYAGYDESVLKQQYNTISTNLGIGSANISQATTEVFDKLHIPTSQRGMFSDIQDTCKYLTAISGERFRNVDSYKDNLEAMVKPLFFKAAGSAQHAPVSFFKYSPQMKMYQGADGEKRLNQDLSETIKEIDRLSVKMGLGKISGSFTWYSDDANKCIRLLNKGRGIPVAVRGANTYAWAGTLNNNSDIKNVDYRVRAKGNAAATVFNYITADDTLFSIASKSLGPVSFNKTTLRAAAQQYNDPYMFNELMHKHNNYLIQRNKGMQVARPTGWQGLSSLETAISKEQVRQDLHDIEVARDTSKAIKAIEQQNMQRQKERDAIMPRSMQPTGPSTTSKIIKKLSNINNNIEKNKKKGK